MLKVKKFFLSMCLALLFGSVFAQLSDDQVIKLVQNAQKQGMGQQEMVMMLVEKGVTKEQILRIKEQVENGSQDLSGREAPVSRMRTGKNMSSDKKESSLYLKENQGYVSPAKMQEKNMLLLDSLERGFSSKEQEEQRSKNREKQVFGREIFTNNHLTFEPNLNIATPDHYVLGPGDEVIVDVWGDSEETLRQMIAPDGNIVVEKIGPIYLAGLTIRDADARLKKAYARIFSTINGDQPTTFTRLSLGNIRSIQVNIMGEVIRPGTYTLPSLASLFHALYSAGGVNSIGSLRCVKVNRGGKEIADVDIYKYILKGQNTQDVALKDGDVVVVAPYQNLIAVSGKIKRPMMYELKDAESLGDLLEFAGGFTGDAYKKAVRVVRKSGREHQIYNVGETDFKQFAMTDADVVSVDSVLTRFENKIEIRGAVYREGLYALEDAVSTVKQLMDKAEGVRGDAFLNRAVLYREKADLTLETESVDIAGIINGTVQDIPLKKNDILYIPSIFDLREDYTLTVRGAVGLPGIYKYAANMSLEDLIVQAGGLKESASIVKVDVARRIKNSKSLEVGNVLAETYTFTLRDGLTIGEGKGFTLQPFDEVYVRTSPGYQAQQNVQIEGEVLFGGTYVLAAKGQRLSDLVKKGGGLTPEAYTAGARLVRRMNDDERSRVQAMLKLTKQGGRDSLDINRLDIGEEYNVGIELTKALERPGSDYDVVLREGDRLIIPQYSGTVKISGTVMYPNTVVYKKNAKLQYYIGQAGGFGNRARKHKVFVVYMNGTVAKSKFLAKAKPAPGCEIIVPMKPTRKGMGLAEILSLTNSTASMAALVTSIMTMSK